MGGRAAEVEHDGRKRWRRMGSARSEEKWLGSEKRERERGREVKGGVATVRGVLVRFFIYLRFNRWIRLNNKNKLNLSRK
jgi:hypothetical protein